MHDHDFGSIRKTNALVHETPGMGDVFSTLEKLGIIASTTCQALKKAVGFSNVAVHNYAVINWEIVFAIGQKSLVDFRQFAKEITEYSRPC